MNLYPARRYGYALPTSFLTRERSLTNPFIVEAESRGVSGAIVAGLVQWLVLRAHSAVTARWTLATVLGATVGTVVGIAATSGVRADAQASIVMSVGAAAIAPSQWFVLRRHFPRTLWWV